MDILRTSAVIAAAWLATLAVRNASASLRYFIWRAAFAIALLLPVAERLAPRWEVAVPAAPVMVVTAIGSAPEPMPQPAAPVWPYLWAAGTLAVIARLCIGAFRLHRIARRAAPVRSACAVSVLESPEIPVPMAWGMLRPIILLPCGSAAWPAARLRAVLLHETIHIRRHDLLTQLGAQLLCALYWFNPLMWAAARRLRQERELSCDDAVLAAGVAAPEYAAHVVDLVRQMRAQRSAGIAPAMAEAAGLETRVKAMLDTARNRRPVTKRAAALAAVCALAVAAPLAIVRAQSQSAVGTLTGVVRDPSGAVVPNCSVTARSLTGRNQEIATANPAGEFAFPTIPAGNYTVEVRAPGFKPASQDVAVEAGKAARAEIALSLGNVAERITIKGKRTAPLPAPTAVGTPQRIRVGGNVQATRIVTMKRPEYPQPLQQLGIEGTVLMRAVISTEGVPLNLEVVNSGVHPELAKLATAAIQQWRYQPTLLNGQPVEVVTTVQVDFKLEN